MMTAFFFLQIIWSAHLNENQGKPLTQRESSKSKGSKECVKRRRV